jgi:hypothetical protein
MVANLANSIVVVEVVLEVVVEEKGGNNWKVVGLDPDTCFDS